MHVIAACATARCDDLEFVNCNLFKMHTVSIFIAMVSEYLAQTEGLGAGCFDCKSRSDTST